MSEELGIKITFEDLEKVQVAEPPVTAAATAPTAGYYGTVAEASGITELAAAAERGSILLQGWFYLGLAGLLGALAGWGICEPWFVEHAGYSNWADIVMVPLIVALVALGCGVAESVVERSVKKALLRAAMALPLGMVLGAFFSFAANIVFGILLNLSSMLGVTSFRNPIFWIARALAWAVFGLAGGTVYGIVGQSFKKGKYGVLGGLMGAAIGGLVFDPICMGINGTSAAVSRAVGFGILGLATGAMMGLVESALKDRWLYVVSGPLAGKQFILYKQQTTLGSDQQCEIYLFKDTTIQGRHAVLDSQGSRVTLRAQVPVYVSGVPVTTRVLVDGDLVQIGRYAFRYKERTRS